MLKNDERCFAIILSRSGFRRTEFLTNFLDTAGNLGNWTGDRQTIRNNNHFLNDIKLNTSLFG